MQHPHCIDLPKILPAVLAASIALQGALPVFAAPGEVNSTNNGAVVQQGNYFNTPGSRTTFTNTNGGGITVQSGSLVRGLESNINGTPNGNGGTLYFRAPDSVVRIDGTVDASALRNGNGAYLGNGGKVFVDSAYLFQNGNVFANGFNGGVVQFNVGGMTAGPSARITAQGFGGNGGAININSPGVVDVRSGAVVDSSGRITGTFDTNVISIEGGLVNNDGIIRANGLATTDFKTNSDSSQIALNPGVVNNPAPGTITAGSGDGTIMNNTPADFATPGPTTNRGGIVRLVSTGQTDSPSSAVNTLLGGDVTSRNSSLISSSNGDVLNNGTVEANGALTRDGGSIIMAAARDITNNSIIRANGADAPDATSGNGQNGGGGGTISLNAMRTINNRSLIDATGGQGGRAASVNVSTGSGANAVATNNLTAGAGGNGGLIGLSALTFDNRATIRANGGVGGVGGGANAFDVESATNPTARATATGGTGGVGGNGGLIVASGNFNPGGGAILRADGGQGGQGGNAWADAHAFTNTGTPQAIATANAGAGGQGGTAGTVVVPDPATLSQSQNFTAKNGGVGNTGAASFRTILVVNGVQTINTGSTPPTLGSLTSGADRALQATHRNELLVNQENALLLSQRGGQGTTLSNLTDRLSNAFVRRMSDQNGTQGNGLPPAAASTNFVIASTTAGSTLNNNFINANTNPIFFNLGSLNILNNGDIVNGMHWASGVHQVGPGFHDIVDALGGGHASWLANGSITNNGFIISRGLWAGGGVNLAATQDVVNNRVILNTTLNKHTATGFNRVPGYISSHSGSTMIKAGRNITNTSLLNSNLAFWQIHPPLNGLLFARLLNAGQIGSTVSLIAGNNVTNNSGAIIGAQALTYRDTSVDAGAQNPANAFGGIITVKRGGSFTNNGSITADGTSLQGSSGNFAFSNDNGLTQVNSIDGQLLQ